MLGMADAPEAREEAVALWAWLRIEWALGLIEAWTITDRTEVSAGRLVSLLEDPLKSLHDLSCGAICSCQHSMHHARCRLAATPGEA